jgi:hypothetical protein
MTLLYSLSNDQDDQREAAADFLSSRWGDVLEQGPVVELCSSLSSSAWTAESFEVLDVEADSNVRVRFTFEAKGLDKKAKPSGDRVSGSAVAVIDVYDHLEFVDVDVA